MSIDLEKLSAKELGALISQATLRKKKLQKRKPAPGVRRQIIAIARKAGYTVAELFGNGSAAPVAKAPKRAVRKPAKAASKVAPKYRHPEHHELTWAARGKQPKWLAAEIASGKSLQDFLIQ